MSLWSKNGGPLQSLPLQEATPDGTMYSNLANSPEGRAALGYVEAECPTIISRMQARVTLASEPSEPPVVGRSLLDDVDDLIATKDQVTREIWKNVSELHRDHPLVALLSLELGWSTARTDDLFIKAKTVS